MEAPFLEGRAQSECARVHEATKTLPLVPHEDDVLLRRLRLWLHLGDPFCCARQEPYTSRRLSFAIPGTGALRAPAA